MRGTSSRQEHRRIDFRSRDTDSSQRKRPHRDPSPEYVPARWRDRDQRQRDIQSKDVTVELGALLETHGSPSRIAWQQAPNAGACRAYRRGSAREANVLDQTARHVRDIRYSLDDARACLLALRKVGLAPDVKVYGALVARCVARGEINEALEVLAEMLTFRVVPDARLYNLLVQACDKAGMDDQVQQLYAAMHQAGIARNASICGLHRNKPKEGAEDVRRVTAACLFDHRHRASWLEALACLGEMKKMGVEPDDLIFRGAVLAYPKECLAKDVSQILDELKHAGIPVGIAVLAQLIDMCEQEDQKDRAMELLKEGMRLEPPLFKPELGLGPGGTLISFYSHGVLNGATREFDTTLSNLARTLIRFHYSNKAIGAGTQFDVGMRNARLKSIVAQCMRDMGFFPVTGIKTDGTQNPARLESGQTVLSRCLHYGDLNNALAVLREIMDQGFLPDAAACSKLISACHEHGRTNDSADVCSALIVACAKPERPERLDDALHYFRQMVDLGGYPDAAACKALIHACGSAGRRDDALAVFGKCLAFPLKFKLAFCNAMISMCEQLEWTHEARLAFNGMLGAGVQPNAGTYFSLIAAYQRDGQPKEKVERLISDAVREGHFDPGLGYVVAQSEWETVPILEFSVDAIVAKPVKGAAPRTVPPHLALALFRHHRSHGRIDANTQWIADDTIKAKVAELISG